MHKVHFLSVFDGCETLVQGRGRGDKVELPPSASPEGPKKKKYQATSLLQPWRVGLVSASKTPRHCPDAHF